MASRFSFTLRELLVTVGLVAIMCWALLRLRTANEELQAQQRDFEMERESWREAREVMNKQAFEQSSELNSLREQLDKPTGQPSP